MIYTKAIREYCLKNVGAIINAQQLANDYFPMVPYKSFLKILNRLRDEGILAPVSKGVYLVKNPEKEVSSEEAVMQEYATDGRGMIVGNAMYRELGVSDYDDGTVEIYTRMISQGAHKTIGKYKLTGVDVYYTSEVKTLFQILELFEHSNDIVNRNLSVMTEFINNNLSAYSIGIFHAIVSHKKYQYSTIASLSRAIKLVKQDDDFCIDTYEEFGLKK